MICPLYEHYTFYVDPNQSAIRIDKFLVDKLANVTRNKIQDAINTNYIEVNGKKDIKSNYKVRPNDIIKIFLPKAPKDSEVIPENIDLDIIYEDNSLMIVNKPSNMVVHPAYNNWSGTLVNALVYHFQNLPNKAGNIGRPGLVHRIDKDTSGLLIIAKTEDSMTALSRQFAEHTIERKYSALVWGNVDGPAGVNFNFGPTDSARANSNLDNTQTKGTIDTYLIKDPKDRRVVIVSKKQVLPTHIDKNIPSIHEINRKNNVHDTRLSDFRNNFKWKRYATEIDKKPLHNKGANSPKSELKDSENGKRAITHYRVLKRFKYCTLLECTLETGRTHQIRAHMKHIGHPIFGDKTYGGDIIVKGPVFSKYKAFVNNCFKIMPYQALHAKSIGFMHPENNEFVRFESDLPPNFAQVVAKWEKYENVSS